jgi:two-component system sensor histidine kinase UhpB
MLRWLIRDTGWITITRWLRGLFLRPPSVGTQMVGLILVVVGPLLLFSAFLVLRSAEHEQETMASTVRERTQAASAVFDRQLGVLRARLFILAASAHLQSGDLAEFRHQASDIADQLGVPVIVSDLNGQELLDTRVPIGEPLPMMPDVDAIRRVVASWQSDISNLTADTFEKFMIALSVPVLHEDQLVYVLTFNIAPAVVTFMQELGLPSDWIVAISDRNGVTIARSHEAARFVGQMGRLPIIERFRAADSGSFPLISRDGVPVYNAFTRMKFADWTIAVGMPDAVLFAPVRRSTWLVTLIGGVTLAVALLLAILIARRIANPITALVRYADVVGRGEHIDGRSSTGIQETDAVLRSLHKASERLNQSAAERDRVEGELRRSEQNYRALSEDLAAANEERAELLHRTVTAQEAERKRIARELHDSIGQYLTALRLGMNAIEPHVAPGKADDWLAKLKELTAELGGELNRMAWELRPMALDDLGLRSAIAHYLEEWSERARLHVDLEIALDERRLPAAVETVLFRVLQEAITNVVKHSGADRVGVVLEAMDGEVRLIVEDNGRGFALDSHAAHALGLKHLGLLGMRERLALVGGRLEVESAPGDGTTVYVCVPI